MNAPFLAEYRAELTEAGLPEQLVDLIVLDAAHELHVREVDFGRVKRQARADRQAAVDAAGEEKRRRREQELSGT